MRWLSTLSLIVSVCALGLSVVTWRQAEARAEEALARREAALVEKHRAGVLALCREFKLIEPSADARTLDELLAPVGKLLVGLSR